MKLTLAITVYNRYEMLLESFANVIDDPRIDEILIMDDCSEPEYWNKIKELPKFNPKIKVVRQLENRGMSVNKRDAVFNSSNEWVIIGDSDNIFGKKYIDSFCNVIDPDFILNGNKLPYTWNRFIFCPSFAKPNFDYQQFQGQQFGTGMMDAKIPTDPLFFTLLNTCNYVVNREKYLIVWKENPEMKGSDTIWFNYLWLKAGGCLAIVPGMHYEHRVHPGSGFLQDADYNMKKAEEIKKLIMQL